MSNPATLDSHPLFPVLRGELQAIDGTAKPFAGDRIHAAVSLILSAGETPELLLIRRAEAEGDPWSGHMALPGGRVDASDPDLLHTAMRETLEETGIGLEEVGVPLGRLPMVAPANRRLPPIAIHPFVFGVPGGTRAHPASREVAEVVWAPLPSLRCPSAASSVEIHLGDVTRSFPCLKVEKNCVWGLTYHILTDFFGVLEGKDG